MKMAKVIFATVFAFQLVHGQTPKPFFPEPTDGATIEALKKEFGNNKSIPAQYEQPILIALSFFPELKDISIDFRVRKTNKAPLTTIPSFHTVLFSSPKRKYIITIRNLMSKSLQPILFQNLPFNAQIGVIGHELSHVLDFHSKTSFGLIGNGISTLSYKFVDRFEYKTDSICIAHGLGYQLLEWSTYVRASLHRENWIGAGNANEEKNSNRERYMNPETIIRRIATEPIYNKTLLQTIFCSNHFRNPR
jgi:hypothetical protein